MYQYDRPMAAKPYTSYRYSGPYGGVAIGAMNDAEALNEAKRSLSSNEVADISLLEKWNGEQWVKISI